MISSAYLEVPLLLKTLVGFTKAFGVESPLTASQVPVVARPFPQEVCLEVDLLIKIGFSSHSILSSVQSQYKHSG